MNFRLHATEHASRANGPGLRAVIWFQGCTLGCPGCFNPGTHDSRGGIAADSTQLAAEILARREPIEGFTISGGEPFQQPEALLDLLRRITPAGLSVVVFTGFTLNEVQRLPLGPSILCHVDALIAGRYVEAQHLGRALLGSRNQRLHLLTARYTVDDFAAVPRREVIVHSDGSMTLSGISPWRLT